MLSNWLPIYTTVQMYLVSSGILILILTKFLYNRYFKNASLRNIPGPFLGSITDVWRIWRGLVGTQRDIYVALPRNYASEMIRVGPNAVTSQELSAIKAIFAACDLDQFLELSSSPHIHAVRNDCINVTSKGKSSHAFIPRAPLGDDPGAVLHRLEPLIDETTGQFFQQFAKDGHHVSNSVLDAYAYEALLNLTFSASPELTPKGAEWDSDVDLSLRSATVTRFASQCWQQTIRSRRGLERQGDDLLDILMQSIGGEADEEAKSSNEELLDHYPIFELSFTNAFATARMVSLSLVGLFRTLVSPDSARMLERLVAEVDNTIALSSLYQTPAGDATILPVGTIRHMPYLNAAVDESIRLFSVSGPPVECVIKTQSTQLNSDFGGLLDLQPGTAITFNSWATLEDSGIFGSDALRFRPERWLEVDDRKRQEMERCLSAAVFVHNMMIREQVPIIKAIMCKFLPPFLRRYKIWEWVLVFVTFVMASLRIYIQLRYRAKPLRELFVVIAWVFYCVTAICDSIMNCYHWYDINQDLFNNLPRKQVEYVLKFNYWESFLYKPSIYACKAALLCFYGDLSPKQFYPKTHRTIQITWFFIIVGVLVQLLYDFLECWPFELNWSPEGAACSYSRKYFYTTWSFHIFTDVLVYTIPFFILHHLRNLTTQQKVGAGAMFAVGFINLLCAGALLALSILQYSSATILGVYNFMYTLQQASAIVVVCMPQMRLVVSRRYSVSLKRRKSSMVESGGSSHRAATMGSRNSKTGKWRGTASESEAGTVLGEAKSPTSAFEEGGKLEARVYSKDEHKSIHCSFT